MKRLELLHTQFRQVQDLLLLLVLRCGHDDLQCFYTETFASAGSVPGALKTTTPVFDSPLRIFERSFPREVCRFTPHGYSTTS